VKNLRMAFRWFGAPRILQADNGSLLFVLYKHTCTHTHAHTHTLTCHAPGPGGEFKSIAMNKSRSAKCISPSPKKCHHVLHVETGVEQYRCEEFDKGLITEIQEVNAI